VKIGVLWGRRDHLGIANDNGDIPDCRTIGPINRNPVFSGKVRRSKIAALFINDFRNPTPSEGRMKIKGSMGSLWGRSESSMISGRSPYRNNKAKSGCFGVELFVNDSGMMPDCRPIGTKKRNPPRSVEFYHTRVVFFDYQASDSITLSLQAYISISPIHRHFANPPEDSRGTPFFKLR
jgi:hypothetical protein